MICCLVLHGITKLRAHLLKVRANLPELLTLLIKLLLRRGKRKRLLLHSTLHENVDHGRAKHNTD
jgi:hypothetical protein